MGTPDGTCPPWLEGLDGDAVPRLIETNAPIVRVVAGPGAGKTTGLKRRVRRLLEKDDVDPSAIFVGTFTRAVTADLAEELDEYAERGVRVSTLHSHALLLLLENRHVLAGHTLRFLLDFEQDAMLYDVKERTDDDRSIHDLRDTLERLGAARSERRTLEDARFSGEVDRWLRQHDGMLIHEVVPMVTKALEGGDLPPGRYDHVIVDEYQDLTLCEQEMVELIWSREGSLVVLGDDDQSIYGFRYNHPDGVTGFAERHDGLEDIPIQENRRSGREIVHMANLMMQEAGPTKDPMVATKEFDGQATLVQWPSVEEEIKGLARHIREREDEDFLVLVPRRLIGYRLRDAIGGDARTEFRQEVLDHELAEERFALATLLADPDDKVAVRAWLGFHYNGSQANQRNAPAYASVFDPDRSGRETITGIAEGRIEPGRRGQKNVRRRAAQLHDALDRAPSTLEDQIEFLFDPRLSERIEDEETAGRVAQDLERLRAGAHQIRESLREPSLERVVERLRYRITTRAPLLEREEDARIRIMTLHSAKGLEADVIVIAGAADQMIPGDPDTTEDYEEQRRLLYVAVTRAREELIVSWPRRIVLHEARDNRVREDDGAIFRADGEVQLGLGRTSLLPADGLRPLSGARWLEE
jgi:superfamily I DNA/RNA helicase